MEVLKLKTLYLNPLLSEEDVDKYNASNGIIISKFLFEEITNKESINQDYVNKVLIIGLYYKNKKLYVNIIDSHNDDPQIIYVPSWIYHHLNYVEDEMVNYMRVYPKVGNKIKIKPRGDFYAYLEDPVSALRDGFEHYSCLIKDTVILINVNGIPLEVEILETFINNINNKNQPIYIRGIELEVDIEDTTRCQSTNANLINPIPSPNVETGTADDDDFSSMFPMPIENKTKFPGKGNSLI
jgi:hypothetical protein